MNCVGINIGAVSVKVARLGTGPPDGVVVAHRGRPREVLAEVLARDTFRGAEWFGVSGLLGGISEVAAIERALRGLDVAIDAVASLGGESFLVYVLRDRRVLTVLSHNKCAAGSGEFLVQQVGRMGLTLEEAVRRSFDGKVVPLASRCSVHCKSDITHKLNRGEASADDVLHTLHASMADKIASLVEKAPRTIEHLLVIGGPAQNEALIAALRAKMPATGIVVLPESPYFEALGTAFLVRDAPSDRSPDLAFHPGFARLPPLGRYAERVRVVVPDAAGPGRTGSGAIVPGDGPLVLGVDSGSTTTKTCLVHPVTRATIAACDTRTRGDPVAATRECLRALAAVAGNLRVHPVGVTGSAREIVGAWLGTAEVYNEISSHAAGAAHFDADVDTIFEIGGQDAKFIALRNGVPVDYAMNAACSAGTGSFLEESAGGDLGIPVGEIAGIALAAGSPVQFKATCAAFINSDVRMALQQGHARDDIVAGLVYAVATNYLTKVKGPRRVGRRVFLQGGVALNRAVGHAFAHLLDRDIVIPPHPELLGALGVALLALQHRAGAAGQGADLDTLAAATMTRSGQFTCGACRLYCTVDRFEVRGRHFPFGGRCSLFENVWKRKARTASAPDLVEARTAILFGDGGGRDRDRNRDAGAGRESDAPGERECGDEGREATPAARANRVRIGIPRALTTHSLYPLYSTFFARLGMTVVLSRVDPRGELRSHAGFCFPAQIAHGAVLDLLGRRVTHVFVPHVSRMPRPDPCVDSYLCPVTQAGPYVLSKSFAETRFLSPLLDFSRGYAASTALIDLAVNELAIRRDRAREAFEAAVAAQLAVERSLREMGARALEEAIRGESPAVLLVGRSYNALAPEASQSVARKLASMGIVAIPADCLPATRGGQTSWHFANMILNAAALARRHRNLFLLCVSNFSCTVDAFTYATLSAEMGSKPCLVLEIDAHTADAGVQTRLEAFLHVIRNYREAGRSPGRPFVPARLAPGGGVITSSGEHVSIRDPRVSIHFPAFSAFHSDAVAMGASWLGLHVGNAIRLDRAQLDRGLLHTSGRECLPLPICVGQLLEAHEARAPGEIVGFYMVRGGAPCVVDSYLGYFERFIAEEELPDLFMFAPGDHASDLGAGRRSLMESLAPAILVADVMVEIEQTLRVVGGPDSTARLRDDWRAMTAGARSPESFQAALPDFVDRVAALPRSADPADCPRVLVTGDFFTRFSPFFMEGVGERYAARGIILKPEDLAELVLYGIYDGIAKDARAWGLEPGHRATLKACTRLRHADGRAYLARRLAYASIRKSEARYRRMFERTGLLVAGPNDVASLFREAARHISPALHGEAIPSVGKAAAAAREGYDGVILIGPFNCLPFRISEAILKPLGLRTEMPTLTYESDGFSVPPSFLRQVDAHVQQVLARHATRRRRPAGPVSAA